MKIQSEALIRDLISRTKEIISQAETFRSKTDRELNFKANPESWSALECLEHLNLYGRFYLPEITRRLRDARSGAEPVFKSGILGNYFANSMLPKESGLKKMKTFKNMNPINSQLDKTIVIDEFLEQQQGFLNLLEQACGISLNKTKTSISISKLIKLKLGDTFRFVIYHNQRHIIQARRVLNFAEKG